MTSQRSFGRRDIGGELLPILTSGLYRDKLDTLREYIQNSIDAHAKHITIAIDPTVVSIDDDGDGMTEEEARNALRLGISEKNPLQSVGFRGIGIYSAFNICDRLEIYTKSTADANAYVLAIDFKLMRDRLLEESERRKQGLPPALFLEMLLEQAVSIGTDRDQTVRAGTRAILSQLLPEVYEELNDWSRVTSYLENVVPLPFRPTFLYKKPIEERLNEEDFRVVPLSLQIGSQRQDLFRPYHNDMFTHGGKYEPKYVDVKNGATKFGFAWVCINDARRVLKDANLRGLLIKKFDFSIANRQFLEPYFGRTVFNRRITGELIVQHEGLVPNAARSDFEHNRTRQEFFQKAIPSFITEISRWANDIQESEKALEVLASHLSWLSFYATQLPRVQRDRERLLSINAHLTTIENDLNYRSAILKRLDDAGLTTATNLLRDDKRVVTEALQEQSQTRRRLEERVAKAVQTEVKLAEQQSERSKESPRSLVELFDNYELIDKPELRNAIQILDEEFIQPQMSEENYTSMLAQLGERLDEAI